MFEFGFGFEFSFFFEVRQGSKFDFWQGLVFHCSKLGQFWQVIEVRSSIWSENGSGSLIFTKFRGIVVRKSSVKIDDFSHFSLKTDDFFLNSV